MIVPALVEGGKATAGPPLGPALGPSGVNIQKVIGEINEKTASFKGLQVPVKVIVDEKTKEFKIEVGTPPISALLKKEIGKEKGAKGEKGVRGKEIIGDISLEKVVEIAKSKSEGMLGKSLRERAKEVLGTALSAGISVNGIKAKDIIKEIEKGNIKISEDGKIEIKNKEEIEKAKEEFEKEEKEFEQKKTEAEKAEAAAAATEAPAEEKAGAKKE